MTKFVLCTATQFKIECKYGPCENRVCARFFVAEVADTYVLHIVSEARIRPKAPTANPKLPPHAEARALLSSLSSSSVALYAGRSQRTSVRRFSQNVPALPFFASCMSLAFYLSRSQSLCHNYNTRHVNCYSVARTSKQACIGQVEYGSATRMPLNAVGVDLF